MALLRNGTPIPFLPPSHRSKGIKELELEKSEVKIKEEIKKSGVFWLPSFPEPMPGVLSISNEKGIVLEVDKSLINDPASLISLFTNLDNVFQVIGHIQEDGFVILDGCQISTSGLNFNLGQIQTSQTIWANRVFTGFPHIQHLKNGIPSFNAFEFSIEGIDEWLWIHGIDEDYNHEERAITISCKQPEGILFNLTNGMRLEIMFDIGNTDSRSPWERGVSQKAYFNLVSDNAQKLDEYLSIAHKIVDLLCFTINETVHLDSMSATSPEIIKNHGDPAPITIYAPSVFYYSKDQPKIDRNRMLFGFSDIRDNAEGMINKWIESYEDYKNAFDLYFLAQLKPQLSLEVKFLTLAQGLEVYHRKPDEDNEIDEELVASLIDCCPEDKRDWLKNRLEYPDRISLRQRIKELINPFKEIFGNSEKRNKLTNKILDTRNYLTHYDPESEPEAAKGADLHVLCLKMELLFELHFLKLTGFAPEKIQSIADKCPKLQWKRSSSLSEH